MCLYSSPLKNDHIIANTTKRAKGAPAFKRGEDFNNDEFYDLDY